jgi:hypothetical protein
VIETSVEIGFKGNVQDRPWVFTSNSGFPLGVPRAHAIFWSAGFGVACKTSGDGTAPVKIPLEIRVSYWIFIYFWGSFGGSFDLGGRDSKLFGKHIQKQRTHRNMINT